VNILVVGSSGYIGEALLARLLRDGATLRGRAVAGVTALDLRPSPPHARLAMHTGSIVDPQVLKTALQCEPDVIFHLASVPGGAAERDFELGLQVNLQATLGLLEAIRVYGRCPRLVFASTVAVYGAPLPELINESSPATPTLSYGAQKLVGELLLADYSRRGFVDGVSLRLPGIVARPPSTGMLSIFLSDLIRELSAGRQYHCPVPAHATSWWMSRGCMVDNLLHAAELGEEPLAQGRTFLMPVLRASMAEVAASIARSRGAGVPGRVSYGEDEALQAQFANLPPLHAPRAEAAGFRHDGTLGQLVKTALE
jgi:nucleoside-diphosphate-sugar epimerase